MKYWIVVLVCWVAIYFIMTNAVYAAPPLPSVNGTKTVTIPVIQSDDGRYWAAELQCDNGITNCIVIYAKEICRPGVTNFSPSVCWELGR